MIDRLRLLPPAVLAAILISFESSALAVPLALDTAGDPAYAAEAGGAWKGQYVPSNPVNDAGQNPPGTDNGGSGFGIWNFSGGFNGDGTNPPYGLSNHFIDGVDFAASAFNDLGAPAFGLAGYNGFYLNDPNQGTNYAQPQAMRPFAQPLAIGETFSADIDTPASYDGVSDGTFPWVFIRFLSASGAVTAELNAGEGSGPNNTFVSNWKYVDAFNNTDFGIAAGVGSIAPTATSDGSSISLLRTGASTGVLSLDGASVNVTFAAGVPTAVRFLTYEFTAGGTMGNPTGEQAFFFNNLQIVPEPSSLAMMLLAGLSLISARSRVRPCKLEA
jgi:hypothetical protein